MPARLRPTAPIAADAVLVGDPGRALMLAQELLEAPKMCNHARGLWGYSGQAVGGERLLTVQSTGIGGPSAALVLGDLVELGLRRAVRVGTCAAISPGLRCGRLLIVTEAHAWSGSLDRAAAVAVPDPELSAQLNRRLGSAAVEATVASLDTLHVGGSPAPVQAGEAADMQTATLLRRGSELRIALAAVLIVTESASAERLGDDGLELAAKAAGNVAAAVLSA
ncbi:MAG: hypothetical protein H0X42_12325 [Solirubrobacterales bacterium]|nr:hypothetical protein [Solirubrobacterales bacterium]